MPLILSTPPPCRMIRRYLKRFFVEYQQQVVERERQLLAQRDELIERIRKEAGRNSRPRPNDTRRR